jgi:ATP-binding cassette, subfamily B, bacterial
VPDHFKLSPDAHQRTLSPARLPAELRWLATQIQPLLRWHLWSFLCITAGSLLALLTPLILKWLVDAVIPHHRLGFLSVAVALIFVGHEGRVFFSSLGSYLMLTASQKMALDLRISLLRHVDSLAADFYESTAVGTILYPFKEPIDEISYLGSDMVPAILRMMLTTAFTLIAMFMLSPKLTLTVLPVVPVFLIVRQYFRSKITIEADVVQNDRLFWSNFLEEHVSAAVPIQLVVQERRQERLAFRLLARLMRSQQKLYRTGSWFTVWSSMAVAVSMCAVIGYGGASVMAGTMSVGGLVAFYGFIAQLFDPLSGACDLYARAQRTFASIRQLTATFSLQTTVSTIQGAPSLSAIKPLRIDFDGVEFGYARQKAMLRIPRLCVVAGESVAIIGANGAGKSTVAKLIVRLYDPTVGSIRIAGDDIRAIDLKDLRRNVCYLARDATLFEGTVESNLRFIRPDASLRELEEAIEWVGLTEMVGSLPHGLNERVGPKGCQLSGGERQRLALARAVLQSPKVLILDEATSCLDAVGEMTILSSIRRSLSGSTLIVISHRQSTLSGFARVLRLAHGQIVHDSDQGVHRGGKIVDVLRLPNRLQGPGPTSGGGC